MQEKTYGMIQATTQPEGTSCLFRWSINGCFLSIIWSSSVALYIVHQNTTMQSTVNILHLQRQLVATQISTGTSRWRVSRVNSSWLASWICQNVFKQKWKWIQTLHGQTEQFWIVAYCNQLSGFCLIWNGQPVCHSVSIGPKCNCSFRHRCLMTSASNTSHQSELENKNQHQTMAQTIICL